MLPEPLFQIALVTRDWTMITGRTPR